MIQEYLRDNSRSTDNSDTVRSEFRRVYQLFTAWLTDTNAIKWVVQKPYVAAYMSHYRGQLPRIRDEKLYQRTAMKQD